MGKKKAIKLATATAIAASAFVAVAPTQSEAATNSVDKAITKAVKQMAKAYDTYHKAAKNDGVLPATGTIRNQAALAKDYYDKAKAEIAKNGGSKAKKAAYTKQLDSKKYYLERAQNYVNAVNTNLKPSKSSFTKAVDAGKAKQVLAAQTVLNKDIARFEGKVAKIYGPDARNLLLKKYADPASKLADSVNDEMKVYNAYKQIESGFLIEKDIKKAGALIESVEAEVKKLEAKNTKLAKNLLAAVKKNKDAYELGKGKVSQVLAINATTVELTYKEAVKDVEAKDFSIEGLTVTNAVVKQSDSKKVVLTTSTQTGGKEYTIKSGDTVLGSFKGISAVIPTAVKVTTPSIQGKIGKEATVKATVTVPEGQSKAGIPVSISIPAGNSLNPAITAEVYTDANGEASYSYTRYSEMNDNVVVYATGDRSVFSTANVYWANSLEVSEVTAGNTLANGSKKVYKVTGAPGTVVNVAFKENVQVTPDKLVTGVKIEDAVIKTLNADGTLSAANGSYPYEVTTGGVQVALVKLNAQGTATFTVTGSNATVTPVVFADGSYDANNLWTGNGKLGSTELQAVAPAVTFVLNQTIGLNVKAEGVRNAAAKTVNGDGGRNYTVSVTDKDGKTAPAGTVAYVVFPKGSIGEKAVYLNGTQVEVEKSYPVTVDSKGQVVFKLTGDKDGYATPTIYLDNGSSTGKLDNSDLQTIGEITYFVDAVVEDAKLEVIDSTTKKAVSSLPGDHTATFTYHSVDQNGFDYVKGNGKYEVTYQVTAMFNDVTANGVTIPKGTTKSIKVDANQGKAELNVLSVDGLATTVSVNVSSSQITLPNKSASVTFTSKTNIADVYTGTIESYNKAKEEVKFKDKDSVSYKAATFKNEKGNVIDKKEFEDILAKNTVKVTYTKTTDGKVSFEIIDVTPDKSTPDLSLVATVVGVKAADGVKEVNGVGSEVGIKVTFSDAVTVTGTPTLSLNVGGTTATYDSSSSSSKELVFKYKVAKGDVTPANTALTVTGIKDGKIVTATSGLDANLNVSKTLSGVTVDGILPVVSGVTNGQVVPSGNTVTPTFTEGKATISKDDDTATALTSGQVISAAGSYKITLTDDAGNVTTVDFKINA